MYVINTTIFCYFRKKSGNYRCYFTLGIHCSHLPSQRMNPSNVLAKMFSRQESSRTCLGHDIEKSYQSYITPRNNSAVVKISSTGVGDNTPSLLLITELIPCLVGMRKCFRSSKTIPLIETHLSQRNHIFNTYLYNMY